MAIPNENADITIVNQNVHVEVGDQVQNYMVSGIIYYGEDHFITRMFHADCQWIYDGIVNSLPLLCNSINADNLNHFFQKKASIILYIKAN